MVRRKGFKTMVKTFDTRTDAKKWARAVERKLDTGDSADYSEASKIWGFLLLFTSSVF